MASSSFALAMTAAVRANAIYSNIGKYNDNNDVRFVIHGGTVTPLLEVYCCSSVCLQKAVCEIIGPQ